MTTTVRFQTKFSGKPTRKSGVESTEHAKMPMERIPRVSRLLALAHKFENLVRDGQVRDYADLARLGHVTRARLTQIMNLLSLAPEIQEAILFLPRVAAGRDTLTERQLRPIVAVMDWGKQKRMWTRLRR